MTSMQIMPQVSFNGGEISPRLRARVDQQVYGVSVAAMVGYIPILQGPAISATGSRFVEGAAGDGRLLSFEYSPTQAYVVEATDGEFRFYTNDARLETSPGVPYAVAHPYSVDELWGLSDEQSFDVKYLVGAGKAPRQLVRTAADTFALSLLDLRNGPIGDSNNDDTITVGVSATTGTIQLYASAAIYKPTDVGSLFELEAADYSDIPSWEPGISRTAGDKCTWDGKVYQAMTSGRTGTVSPIHSEGEEWDGSQTGTDINSNGPYGIRWKFLHGRHGLARITAYTSPSIVSAVVIKRFATSLVSTGSWRWAFGAFSDTRGYPDAVKLWDESLVLFKDNIGYVSVVGDPTNFERRDSSGNFQRDLSGSFSLPNNDSVRWAVSDRQLIIGTDRAEYTVERLITQGAGAGPPVFQVKLQGTTGSARGKPIQASGRILFNQRARRKLHELAYAFATDRYNAPNVARLADHIAARGIAEMAFAQEPLQIAWAVLEDGGLAGMTYDPDQQVIGWFRRDLPASLGARSICRISDPSGTRDQIWLLCETEGVGHWVLRLEKTWELGDDPVTVNMTDAGLSYSGPAVSSGSGAAHLAGMTVSVLADGQPHPDIVIGAGGTWSLERSASDITLGLAFPAYIDLLPIGGVQADPQSPVRVKRIPEVTARLMEAGGLAVSVQAQREVTLDLRPIDAEMDVAVPLFTGDVSLTTIGAFDRDGIIRIRRVQPVPSTLLGIVARVEVEE